MKKIFLATIALTFMSSSVFAAGSLTMAFTTTGKTLYGAKASASASSTVIGKTSTGVGLGLLTNASGYAIVTQHQNGTKAFGTNFDSTSMFSVDATKGTVKLGVPTAITTADFSTWKTL